jgi:hypothetical protein
MQDFLNGLSPKLRFISCKKRGNVLEVFCESEHDSGRRVHSRVIRVVKDINFGEYKVELHILWKKYFNFNSQINNVTISERFDFIDGRANRTKRLDNLLLSMQKEMSAIGCERIIKESIADVSDSTILRIIKKNRKNQ